MAIDRVSQARNIIESQLLNGERISNDYKGDAETGAWHSFPIEGSNFLRAGDLALSIVAALGKAGFSSTGSPLATKWTGREALVTFLVRVEIGGVRSL